VEKQVERNPYYDSGQTGEVGIARQVKLERWKEKRLLRYDE